MRAPARTVDRARELRRAMSLPEVILWQHLRGRGMSPLRFRRQHPVGPYVLDFSCPEARLAVEVDGFAHDSQEVVQRDARRRSWLSEQGIQVLRLPAGEIIDQRKLPFSLEAIRAAAGRAES